MKLLKFKGSNFWSTDSAYVEPIPPKNSYGALNPDIYDPSYVPPPRLLSYKNFINGLISAKFVRAGFLALRELDPVTTARSQSKVVAIEITPTVDHEYYEFFNYATGAAGNFERLHLDPIWIRFPLKGAKEAIAKLGKELETAPNISND